MAAALLVRRTLTPPLGLVALCFVVMFAQDTALWTLAEHRVNNLWLLHAGIPVQTALVLGAYSYWQVGELERLTLRFAIVGFLLVWMVLFVWFEEPRAFSRFSKPLQAVLLVSVSAWTLVRRAHESLEPLVRADWFWVTSGLLGYFAVGAVLSPVSHLLMQSAPDLVVKAFLGKAAFSILVYLAIARGILCRMPLETSGGFSSPLPSSPSSSAERS